MDTLFQYPQYQYFYSFFSCCCNLSGTIRDVRFLPAPAFFVVNFPPQGGTANAVCCCFPQPPCSANKFQIAGQGCSSSRSTGRCCHSSRTSQRCQRRCSSCQRQAKTDRTPTHKHRTTQIKGALPLWAAYAAHSPRFPFGESRARTSQVAVDRAFGPFKQDKPAAPTPLHKSPKASHSRTPTVPAFS